MQLPYYLYTTPRITGASSEDGMKGWSKLKHTEKLTLVAASLVLGVSFFLSDRAVQTSIFVPEFGIILFLLQQYSWPSVLLFSTGYLLTTIGFETLGSFEVFHSGLLFFHGVSFALIEVFCRQSKWRIDWQLLGLIVVNALSIALGWLLIPHAPAAVYHLVLQVIITESCLLIILRNQIPEWRFQHVLAALLMVLVMFFSLVDIRWFGFVFISVFLFHQAYGGVLTGLVMVMTYSFFSTYSLNISSVYFEFLASLAFFSLAVNEWSRFQRGDMFTGVLSEPKSSEEANLEEYKQLANIINYSSTVAFLWRAEMSREVEYVSDNAWRIGYSPLVFKEQRLDYNSAIFVDDRERVSEKIAEVIARGRSQAFELEYRILTESGQIIWVVERSLLMKNSQGDVTHIQGTVMDITMNKEAEKRLHRLTYFDELTGLQNRVAFIDALQREIDHATANSESFAILLLDIDKFKYINDNFGHQCGDEIICTLARRFSQLVQEEDYCLARHANDDFIVMMRRYGDIKEVEALADKFLKLVAEPFPIQDRYYPLTASIGISLFPLDGRDVNQLISNANVAVYQAKEIGKNHFMFYNKAMRSRSLLDLRLASDLNLALQQEQFVLYYQPKINLNTHKPAGAEVLIRWQHPERGLLSPNEFVSLAEETGVIIEIGAWVFKTACEQLRKWQESDLEGTHIAINLSPRQFWNPGFIDFVRNCIEETGVRPQAIELELTESMVMRDPEQYRIVMREIKEIGIKISVDDFGVGHSSLNQIKRFPIDAIKIDKSFIIDLLHDTEDQAITKAIVALGHSLNLKVVAEGVEDAAQADFLESIQCDEAQGYFFSKPLSAKEYSLWHTSFNRAS